MKKLKIKRQSVPEHRLDCLKVDPDDKLESKDLFNGFFNTDLKEAKESQVTLKHNSFIYFSFSIYTNILIYNIDLTLNK